MLCYNFWLPLTWHLIISLQVVVKSFEFFFDHLYRPLSEGIKGSVILLTRFAPLVSFFSPSSHLSLHVYYCVFKYSCWWRKGKIKKYMKIKSCLVQCNFFLSETRRMLEKKNPNISQYTNVLTCTCLTRIKFKIFNCLHLSMRKDNVE